MHVEICTRELLREWLPLREALWPQVAPADHAKAAIAILDRADREVAFLVREPGSALIGFAEASLRHDHVNGCDTSPVAFLEGIYVHPEWRMRGAARMLCGAVEEWAIARGCSEFASDTDLLNLMAQQAHEALGFEKTERVVYYRKRLATRR